MLLIRNWLDSNAAFPTVNVPLTSNVGLGSAALDSLTASSGNYNVALGVNAGTAITTGDNNIAIGFDALKTASTQSEATAVGYKAAEDLAGGVFGSTFIGVRAGSNVTTGWGNTGIGHDAINSENGAGTGSSNTAVGYQALRGATGSNAISGNQNVALGGNAIEDITSGSGNAGVGYQSLTNLTTGSYNIGLGYRSGDNITTGSNNLVIGNFDVDVATGDDQIIIGSGDGGVTWIKGDSNGIKALKIKVKAVSSNTTLTDAQSGSYVYWTAGTLTLPATAESGQQYTIINNTGGSATPALGTSNAIASGWTAHAAMADETARTYVSVAANTWIYIG